MGSALSSLRNSAGSREQGEPMALDDEDDEGGTRRAKRRKRNDGGIFHDDEDSEFRRPFGHVMNESTRGHLRSKPELIKPTSFYGKFQSAPPPLDSLPRKKTEKANKKGISGILPGAPMDFAEAMRVDIEQIDAAEPETSNEEPGKVHDIRCKCCVAIFYAKNDNNPGDVRNQDFMETTRLVKTCILRIVVGRDGTVSRKIILPEPFVFQPDHFYVNRRSRKDNGQWGPYTHTIGFADKYSVQVFLEPKGHSLLWPPVNCYSGTEEDPIQDMLKEGIIMSEDLQMSCKTNPWLGAERHSNVQLQISYGKAKQSIPYTLKMQIRWALPSRWSELAYRTLKAEPVRAAEEPIETPIQPEVPTSPFPRRVEDVLADSPDSRAARRRSNVPTYNLKTLSTIAQGKSPRAPRASNARSRSEQRNQDGEIAVTYSFGKAEAAEVGIKRDTTISGLSCPFCLARNRTLDELRLHLHTDHTTYKFHVRKSNPPRVAYFIEIGRNRPGFNSLVDRKKTFQLGRPVTLFDLDQYLNGDDCWTKARQGPDHNRWPEHLHQKHEASQSSSPYESRQSSPNTSNDTDDLMDFEAYKPKQAVRQRKVFYVPKNITKPLYDTVSKRVLVPGEPLPNSDDEQDEDWLYQKLRDGINDFLDITPEEKEFVNQWNPFIVAEHLTSAKYLPDAITRFVEVNKTWLAAKVTRRQEFMKLVETCVIRGVIDDLCVRRCEGMIRSEEALVAAREKEGTEMDIDKVEEVPRVRDLHTCICGVLTLILGNRIACRGAKCPKRFYCRACAKACGRSIVGEWLCDDCYT